MDSHSAPALHPVRPAAQRIAILFFAILQVLVPILPSLGVGTQIGAQSDAARTAITPAGWAFSIWGPLYAGSLAFAIFQLLPGRRASPLLARIGWPSAGAFLGNAAWAAYVQSFGLGAISALIIAFTLLCLLAVYRAFALQQRRFTAGERWLAVLPLSALAAWLTAATIVNVAASLTWHGVDAGPSTPILAAAIVLVGGIIAAAALWNGRANPWYALVFLWALAAIFAAGGRRYDLVAAASLAAALIVVGIVLVRLRLSENQDHWFAAPSGH